VIFKNHLNCFHRMWTTLFCMMNIKHRINFPTPNYWIVFNYKIFANIEFETVFFFLRAWQAKSKGVVLFNHIVTFHRTGCLV
jgi:hypothetical protein